MSSRPEEGWFSLCVWWLFVMLLVNEWELDMWKRFYEQHLCFFNISQTLCNGNIFQRVLDNAKSSNGQWWRGSMGTHTKETSAWNLISLSSWESFRWHFSEHFHICQGHFSGVFFCNYSFRFSMHYNLGWHTLLSHNQNHNIFVDLLSKGERWQWRTMMEQESIRSLRRRLDA